MFVRRVVVQDDVNLLFFGYGLLDLSQKPQHLLVSVLAIGLADYLSRSGRVAAGSYPPAAPTDPGVPNSGTRLLR